nr:carbamoyl phosphate synthase large subunit [Acidobacteriota bacterium]
LMNVQYAVWNGELYIIEANPRCSRTVPFAAKAIGYPLSNLAAQVMAGARIKELGIPLEPEPVMWHVKSPVFPFNKFPGEDSLLGPEMKSTGEVMGNAFTYGNAFAKAYRATGNKLPKSGAAFISVNDRDKGAAIEIARGLYQLGFDLLATQGTSDFLERAGLDVTPLKKLHQGSPNIVDYLTEKRVDLIINTPVGKESHHDDRYIRLNAIKAGVSCTTTLSAARALIEAIRAIKSERLTVNALQDLETPA